MFESFLAVPLHFTIEFFGFLVAAGGAALVLSRPDLVPGPISNRISVALGLMGIAGAAVLHGGSFFPIDGDEVLIATRALSYAFILIGVAGVLRPGAAAVAGFEVKEPLLFAPAGAALFVAFTAFGAAGKDETSHYKRLGAAFALFGVSEAVLAGAPLLEVGSAAVDRFTAISHFIRFGGSLFLAAWLWSAVRQSIRIRYVASFGVLLVGVV
ncbi:MAG TPA: hypothetical protein VFS18_01285, partial [Actinomycetota bacterium]|nr:hypothetical protein [Actinomycetota bacterium]